MKRVCMVLLVVACGPKSTPSNPTGGGEGGGGGGGAGSGVGGGGAPSASTGNAVNLACTGTSQVKCQTPPFTFAATYDTPSDCTWSSTSNELVFAMRSSADANARLAIYVHDYHGPDTYNIDSDTQFVSLAASITRAGGECSGGSATSGIRSHKASCGGCSVVVTDANPSAPYPKPITAAVQCSSLCEEDAFVCGGINLTLTQQCSH